MPRLEEAVAERLHFNYRVSTPDGKSIVPRNKLEEVIRRVIADNTRKNCGGAASNYTGTQRNRVLRFIKDQGRVGATCEEVELALGIRHSSACARIWELRYKKKLIGTNGKIRLTTSGRKAEVLVVL